VIHAVEEKVEELSGVLKTWSMELRHLQMFDHLRKKEVIERDFTGEYWGGICVEKALEKEKGLIRILRL